MNAFLEACGATAPVSLTVEAPGLPAPQAHSFELPFALVGRDPRADLHLDHPDVSDRHAYLQLVRGHLAFLDLGSRLGVYQSGKRVGQGVLGRDPAARVGPFRLRRVASTSPPCPDFSGARDDPAQAAGSILALPEVSDDPPEGDRLIVDLSHRSLRRARTVLRGDLALVGSGLDCAVRFADTAVSAAHAALVRTAAGVWVVDLLGKGGVRVNGQEVQYARLDPGDEVRLGASTLRAEAVSGAPREFGRLGTARPAPWQPPVPNEPTALEVRPAAPSPAEPPPLAMPVTAAPRSIPEAAGTGATAELTERLLAPLAEQFGAFREQMRDDLRQGRILLLEALTAIREEQSTLFDAELEKVRQLGGELTRLRDELDETLRQLRAGTTEAPPSPAPPSLAPTAQLPALRSLPEPPPTLARTEHAVHPHRPHDEQIHAALSERIVRLKDEHQSRWRKWLGTPGAIPPKPSS